MKRLTVFLTAFALAFALAGSAYAFDDLADCTAAQQQAAARLSEMRVMQGDGNGDFRPNDPIDRAEFAKVASLMYLKLSGEATPVVSAPDFSDVSSKAWYALDVATAVKLELMQGDTDGYFRPGDEVIGSEVVTVALRILGVQEGELSGSWPGNYLTKARELGLIDGQDAAYGQPFTRIQVAELMAALPELAEKLADDNKDVGNQEKPAEDTVAKRDYGVLTAKPDHNISVLGFETGAGTYRVLDNCQWQTPKNELTAGQVVYFTLNKEGKVMSVSRQGVFTYGQHEAEIKNGQISFGGSSYKIDDSVDVLLMNSGGGVSRVAVDKLLESNYVADLRSASYSAPLQYVLEGSKLVGLLIGDYKGQSDLHFGYIESYGESAEGMQVQFYGDETNYNWKYIGAGDDEPQESVLYAYRFRADKVEAYQVEVENGYPQIDGETVKNGSNIYLTEEGKQFIVEDDTVVMRVSVTGEGRVYDVSYDEEVSSGDKVDVRYRIGGDIDIEAAYVIIWD